MTTLANTCEPIGFLKLALTRALQTLLVRMMAATQRTHALLTDVRDDCDAILHDVERFLRNTSACTRSTALLHLVAYKRSSNASRAASRRS